MKFTVNLDVVGGSLKGCGVVVVVGDRVVGGRDGPSTSDPIPVHRSVVQIQAKQIYQCTGPWYRYKLNRYMYQYTFPWYIFRLNKYISAQVRGTDTS